jgi:hypothetical protein
MKSDNNILYWVIYFIVTVIIAWIALSLILLWFKPALYNTDGSVNWWVTLWISALIILFAWIIIIILRLIIGFFSEEGRGCNKPKPCETPDPCKKPDPCDPCNK